MVVGHLVIVKSQMNQNHDRYDHRQIEPKVQARWNPEKTFKSPDLPAGSEKKYVLDMFPYPSSNGLHVGHPLGYTARTFWPDIGEQKESQFSIRWVSIRLACQRKNSQFEQTSHPKSPPTKISTIFVGN